jgi:hypothetical protein
MSIQAAMANRSGFAVRHLSKIGVLQLVIGLHFALTYCTATAPFLDLKQYFGYEANMPFQGRVLVAMLFNGITAWHALPTLHGSVGKALPPEYFLYFFTTTLVSVVLVLVLFRDILIRGEKFKPVTADVAVFALLGCLYFNYVVGYEFKYFLPYDMPSVAMWATVLWLSYRRHILILLVAFVLATVNRETVIILAPCVTAIFYWRHKMALSRAVLLGATMLVIWVLAKLALYKVFQGNPHDGNGLAVMTLWKNAHLISNPAHWPQILSSWAFLSIPFAMHWHHITDPCQRVFKWVVVCMLGILLVTGILIETRIFGELSLLVVLCLAGVLNDWLLQSARLPAGVDATS